MTAKPYVFQIPRTKSREDLGRLLSQAEVPFRLQWDPNTPTEEHAIIVPCPPIDESTSLVVLPIFQTEHRYICYLLMLGNPQAKVVYISSIPIHQEIVEYYLDLIQQIFGHTKENLRSRFLLLSLDDDSYGRLGQKLLLREDIKQQILAFVDPKKAYLHFGTLGPGEHKLAIDLGIPLHSPDIHFDELEEKHNVRKFLKGIGVPVVDGTQVARTLDQLIGKISKFVIKHPGLQKILMKIVDGCGGLGHILLDTSTFDPENLQSIRNALEHNSQFINPCMNWQNFQTEVQRAGVIVEQYIANRVNCCPTAIVTRENGIKILATEESMISENFQFQGAITPCRQPYHDILVRTVKHVAENLQNLGFIDQFSASCITDDRDEEPVVYMCEINVRYSGNTHTDLILLHLTGGRLTDDGFVVGKDGNIKYMMYKNIIRVPEITAEKEEAFIRGLREHPDLKFDTETLTGAVVQHSLLESLRSVMLQVIAHSEEEAKEAFSRGLRAITELVEAS